MPCLALLSSLLDTDSLGVTDYRSPGSESATVEVVVMCGDAAEAERLSDAAMLDKLVASSHSWTVESRFLWQGEVVKTSEVMLAFQTTRSRVTALVELLVLLHSYETPVITMREVKVLPLSAERWWNNSVAP